jgi:hypothetical protein
MRVSRCQQGWECHEKNSSSCVENNLSVFQGQSLGPTFVTTAAADETVPTELGGLDAAVFRLDVVVEGMAQHRFVMTS